MKKVLLFTGMLISSLSFAQENIMLQEVLVTGGDLRSRKEANSEVDAERAQLNLMAFELKQDALLPFLEFQDLEVEEDFLEHWVEDNSLTIVEVKKPRIKRFNTKLFIMPFTHEVGGALEVRVMNHLSIEGQSFMKRDEWVSETPIDPNIEDLPFTETNRLVIKAFIKKSNRGLFAFQSTGTKVVGDEFDNRVRSMHMGGGVGYKVVYKSVSFDVITGIQAYKNINTRIPSEYRNWFTKVSIGVQF